MIAIKVLVALLIVTSVKCSVIKKKSKNVVFNLSNDYISPVSDSSVSAIRSIKKRHLPKVTPTLEIAIFIDEHFIKRIGAKFNSNKSKIAALIRDYMTNVQKIFHDPSLGTVLDISVSRIFILPSSVETIYTRVITTYSELLAMFCDHQKSLNPGVTRWDAAILLTGHILEKDYVLGRAYMNTACTHLSCVVVQFTQNPPVVIAHELAHVLGIPHHQYSECNGKFIMSGKGTKWSKCSAQIAKSWHTKPCLYEQSKSGFPYSKKYTGEEYSEDQQCQLVFGNSSASAVQAYSNCEHLMCQTNNKIEYGGLTLDGTSCGVSKFCMAGECVDKI